MNRPTTYRARAWWQLATAFALVAIASCGGGAGVVGSGGTGGAIGTAVGTVDGFGSVIVDGESFDNRGAPAVAEVAPGADANADVKLGQRVALEYEAGAVARVVRVEATLTGAVANVLAPGRFSVLGQTVAVNTSAAAGPITQLGGGYSQPADVRAGDAVEVHGVLVHQGASTSVQATRIDKLAALPAYLRVTGLVDALGAGNPPTLTIGALTVDVSAATVLPAGTALATGQAVTVLALPATLTSPAAGAWQLRAAQVRIRALQGGGLDDYLSGAVAHLDPVAKTFTLGSQRVGYAGATVFPATATLASGQYVQVRGKVGTDGVLVAAGLEIRDAASDSAAQLRGNIIGYVSANRTFSVRGVAVDASGATVQGCPASGLADGLYVEVDGTLGSTGVVAGTVHCEDEPSDALIQREGVASAVDTATGSFTLTPEEGAVVSVRWTSTTYFGGVTPQTLAGAKVQVEGTLAAGVLTASKVTR
ncbi:MAG: hypothetical protein KGI87_13585 [Burkholderiales bacterium]|nr:hypothetical protein [Burkholderiales bacterium]